jgi:hypothetical protein
MDPEICQCKGHQYNNISTVNITNKKNVERTAHSVNLGRGVNTLNILWNSLKFSFGPKIFLSKLFAANSST